MMIPQLGYGGAESAFIRIAEELSSTQNVKIAIMALNYGVDSDYTLNDIHCDLPIIDLNPHLNQTDKHWRSKFKRWWLMIQRVRSLKQESDVAISFLSGANLLNILSKGSCQTIVSERGSKKYDPGLSPYRRWLWRKILDPWIYRRSDRIVAASEELASEIRSQYPACIEKIHAIEGTIRSEELICDSDSPLDADYDDFEAYQSLVVIGRCHRAKGFDFILRVFARIRDELHQARLLIIGDGPEMQFLMRLARELNLRVGTDPIPSLFDVVFAGFRSRPSRFIKATRVFALPSRSEGLPNILLEALASGVSIVAADCPWGIRSTLGSDFADSHRSQDKYPIQLANGLLLPEIDSPGALEVWSKALVSELENNLTRSDLDERRRAISRFDISNTVHDWIGLMD